MDKTKSKGITKSIKHEKQILHYPQGPPGDKDKQFFKVEENDFPSLSEVRTKKAEKDSSTSGLSLFSYSSKLKTLPPECLLQNTKSENVQHVERLSKNESTLHKTGSGGYQAKSVQVNNQSFSKQPFTVPSSNKKFTDYKVNSSFSGVNSTKPEYFNKHTKIDPSYGQKAMYDNRSIKSAESSTFEKMRHSPKKGHCLNPCTSTYIQKPTITKSFSTEKRTNSEYSSASRSDRFYQRESNRPNTNALYKRLDEANRCFRSNAGSDKNSRLSHMKITQRNDSGNTSNKSRIATSSGIQRACDSVKPENSGVLHQSLNVQSSVAVTGETKKKKKRKSKLKRQAALQTGKIFVLTPEAHSKIVNQSNNVCVQKNQNVLTNINDNEEYPELGAAEPKAVKESHLAETNVQPKEENSTNLILLESETSKKIMQLPKESSVNNDIKAATKMEERNINPVEKSNSEKATIHSNNPITLSLFDMLANAKPRKKEPEKKVELANENNGKSFKKEMNKKNISQAVNPLASSKAATKRGKEREKPKVKRPSRMRKLILMERQLRKENAAMKKHESEDKNEEKPDEKFPSIRIAQDNLDTCVEILEKYLANPKNIDEAFDIYENLNTMISEELIDCESITLLSLKSLENTNEKSILENEMMNNMNGSVKYCISNIDNDANECSSAINSILNVEENLALNPASSLKDKEENFEEDSVDIKIDENFSEGCNTNIKIPGIKQSDLESIIDNPCCIEENLLENLKITDDDSQTNNFTDKKQELEQKMIGVNLNTAAESFVSVNAEFKSGKRGDLSETKDLNKNLDSSENIVTKNLVYSFSVEEKLRATKLMLHSRKFRQYCSHFISKEIDQAVFSLIDDLARFQDRMYQKDPVKAKIRRRLVYGMKEIKKHMKLKKVKCIIIATDIEDIKIEGGLNDSLGELISLAEAYQIPCIFSHWRFNLGKVCRKSVPVSCVGIFNYEGSEKNFKKVIELQDDSKHDYLAVTKQLASELTNDQVLELFEAEKESALFLREVSQKILREMVYFTPEGFRKNYTSENSGVVSFQQSDDTTLYICDDKSESFIEEYSEGLTKSHTDETLLQHNQTDVNTILVKYKVVKEG